MMTTKSLTFHRAFAIFIFRKSHTEADASDAVAVIDGRQEFEANIESAGPSTSSSSLFSLQPATATRLLHNDIIIVNVAAISPRMSIDAKAASEVNALNDEISANG